MPQVARGGIKLNKALEVMALVLAGVFFALGAYGVYTGVVSVRGGGYGDNIILGAFVMLAFPLICLIFYLYIRYLRGLEKKLG